MNSFEVKPTAAPAPKPESAPTPEKPHAPVEKLLSESAVGFLGNEKELISDDFIATTITTAQEKHLELKNSFEDSKNKRTVSYDKYNKSFVVGDEKKVSMGSIIAARHLGIMVSLPETLEQSGDGKKIRKQYLERATTDLLCNNLNRELATVMAQKTENKDLLKSKAYEEIAKRSGIESKQLGVVAEQIMIGVAEMISIDRPDLGITVLPANAYQDVEEKIDFIIATKQKKRGASIGEEDLPVSEKHIGIQFTINTSKESFKQDQIKKVRERGMDVDDIVYVAIDSHVLRNAIRSWEDKNKPIAGPWAELPAPVRTKALQALFHEVLTDEQEKSLLKTIS